MAHVPASTANRGETKAVIFEPPDLICAHLKMRLS